MAEVRRETPARGQVTAVGAVGDGIYVSRADGEFPDDPLFRDARDAQVADDAPSDGEVLPVWRDGPELGDDILADDGDDGLVGLALVVGRDGPIEQGRGNVPDLARLGGRVRLVIRQPGVHVERNDEQQRRDRGRNAPFLQFR